MFTDRIMDMDCKDEYGWLLNKYKCAEMLYTTIYQFQNLRAHHSMIFFT